VRTCALTDPGWTARLLAWLRTGAHLRSAALVGAAEFVHARLTEPDAAAPSPVSNRAVIASVLRRADEPGEFLAHWLACHGRRLPMPVKRGLGDAVRALYDERSLLKHDTTGHPVRFADVLELTHPAPRDAAQSALFRHALDRRHERGDRLDGLPVLARHAELAAWPPARRRALFDEPATAVAALRSAGLTWEAVSGWLDGPLTAAVWTALAPTLGYTAALRNLRNLDEAGVGDDVAAAVAARLADPEQVARSRQLPLAFLAAFRAAPSLRWAWALEQALTRALGNVPALPGRTLVLVDTSASMNQAFSRHGTLRRQDAAVVFGLALAARSAAADVVSFSSTTLRFRPVRGESLLASVRRWQDGGYFLGAGTHTAGALAEHFRRHDRVVILTDEQAAGPEVGAALPGTVPLYTWNLAGYRPGHAPSGTPNRHVFGGLSDQSFRLIPLVEAGRDAEWPF
jgi:hypothetical protein